MDIQIDNFFIKSGNDYEFGIQEKENAIDGGILCFTREDAEKHLLKKENDVGIKKHQLF